MACLPAAGSHLRAESFDLASEALALLAKLELLVLYLRVDSPERGIAGLLLDRGGGRGAELPVRLDEDRLRRAGKRGAADAGEEGAQ